MFGRKKKMISEELVVNHCSPTMAGLKTGSLFSCPAKDGGMLAGDIRDLNKRLILKEFLKWFAMKWTGKTRKNMSP